MVYTPGLVRSEPHDGDLLVLPDGHLVSQQVHALSTFGPSIADDMNVRGLLVNHEMEHLVTVRRDASNVSLTLPPGLRNETARLERELFIFWENSHSDWIVLLLAVFVLIVLEQVVSKHMTRDYRTHIAMVLAWVASAACYNIYFGFSHGSKDGLDWFIGYVLEWMLSIDNLFAFQFIIRAYHCPTAVQHKAIFCGAIGALVTRMLLYYAMGSALHYTHYVQFLFGGFLIWAGIQALSDDDESKDPRDFWLVRLLKACLGSRLHEGYDVQDHSLFIRRDDGVLCATLLVPLIFCVEVTDVIFAVDSVSAKVAQIPNQYVAYSSSVMALLGLRAMFFVIEDLVAYFEMLKYGVCVILIFIGSELLISGWFQLPDWCVCVVIVSVFNFCIVLSVLQRLFSRQLPPEASAIGAVDENMTIQPPSEPRPVPPIPQSQAQHTAAPQSRQSSGPVSQTRSQREEKSPQSADEQMRKKLTARRSKCEAEQMLLSAGSASGGTGEMEEASAPSTSDQH